MRRRQLLHAVAAPALAGGLTACGRAPEGPAPTETLRLAIDLWPGYLPGVLADELGWLSPEGIQLKVFYPGDTDKMLADFTAGRYDLMGASLGDLITITRGHLAVKVVTITDESAGGDMVLGRPGLQLRPDGHYTIATNLGGFGEVFLQEFLRRHHLESAHWSWVNADGAEVPSLLAAGKLDVGHTWDPYASRAVAAGAQRLFTSQDTPGLVCDVLVATNATIQRRDRLLRRFLRFWFQAVDWWLAHPAEARQLLARRVNMEPDRISLEGLKLLGLARNRQLMIGSNGQGPGLTAVVQRYSDFFVDKGSVVRPLVAGDLLDGDLLP